MIYKYVPSIKCVILFTLFVNVVFCFKSNHRNFFDFLFNNPTRRCNCKCGIPNRESRLLGGEFLRGHEFPWIVSIPIRSQTSASGVLINDQYVLTAASQMIGFTPYDIKVILGQYDSCFPDLSSIQISVETLIIHPDFNPGNRAHDLALLKLSNIASLERRIKPICLPTPGTNYLGQVATVIGWSESITPTAKSEATCRPRKLGLPVLGKSECMSTVSEPEYFSTDKGCVGVIGGPAYLCKTDAGAPVTFRSYKGIYELIGILTDKNDCGSHPSTAMYTKINENIKWILYKTRDSCYCSKI